MQKCDRKDSVQQNTVRLEQETYSSSKNFTQALIVMIETFIMYSLDLFQITTFSMDCEKKSFISQEKDFSIKYRGLRGPHNCQLAKRFKCP